MHGSDIEFLDFINVWIYCCMAFYGQPIGWDGLGEDRFGFSNNSNMN